MNCTIVTPAPASYVRRDAQILARRHRVSVVTCHRPIEFLALPRAVGRADVVIVWFAKLHALAAVSLARLMHRPTVVVAAGDDVCALPELGYGMFSSRHKAWCPDLVARGADVMIAVSDHARRSAQLHLPRATEWPVVHLGFDEERFRPVEGVPREHLVLTAARVTRETLRVKGLDLLLETARRLPEIRFVLAGAGEARAEREFDRNAPPNVRRIGWLSEPELVEWYSRAAVYFQPSLTESFGAAVAEAMLCGAIPVVAPVGALPEVVGDAGVYASPTPAGFARGIGQALGLGEEASAAARARIVTCFPEANREAGLEAAIAAACGTVDAAPVAAAGMATGGSAARRSV